MAADYLTTDDWRLLLTPDYYWLLTTHLDVDEHGGGLDALVAHDDHRVGGRGEALDEAGVGRVAHLQRGEPWL